MFKKLSLLVLILGLTVVVTGCSYGSSNSQSNNPPAPAQGLDVKPVQTSPTMPSNKFVDQDYYQYAYLISGPVLSADAKLAITGFNLSKKALADGAIQFTLKALKSEYKDQSYTLKPGEELYFIEKNLKDDVNNEEKYLADDSAVVVDASGNVVQGPADFSQGATVTVPPPPTPAVKPAANLPVKIVNLAFAPQQLTINKGDSVTWTNNDPMAHQIASDSGKFNSQQLTNGQSYTFTFTAAGQYPYHCKIHPSMTGTIIVK